MEKLHPPGESILARCRVTAGDATRARGILARKIDDSSIAADAILVDVLLSRPGAKDLAGVESGTTIRLWRPWVEVDLDSEIRTLPTSLDGHPLDARQPRPSAEGTEADYRKENEYALRCLSGEEGPGSYSKNVARDHQSRCTLLCSRFIVG